MLALSDGSTARLADEFNGGNAQCRAGDIEFINGRPGLSIEFEDHD